MALSFKKEKIWLSLSKKNDGSLEAQDILRVYSKHFFLIIS
jgi:hypothetical protein